MNNKYRTTNIRMPKGRTSLYSIFSAPCSSVLFGIAFLFLSTLGARAQDSFKVLDWKSHVSWHKYLIQQMHDQYHKRDKDIEKAFTSKQAAQEYRREINEQYRAIKGSFPKLSPLHAQVKGEIKEDGYRIEKVVYESFANHHVTANLYIPDSRGKHAGALFFCGHEREAKATVSYQKTAVLLAQNDFVVLVIDPISQAERFQLTDSTGKPITRGGTTEHTLLNAGSNLVGTNVVNYEYWDNKRGLDYLLSRPEVDTSRVGVLGNSGGGTMTTYFMALNDNKNVKVAVPCSYVTKRERAIEVLGPQDGCQWVPYEGRHHLEIDDFLMMHAPVPTLVLAGQYDFVDYVGVKRTMREMKDFYTTLNHPEDVKLFSWADGHGISKPKREAAVQWFNRWFHQDSSQVTEGNLKTHSEKDLRVTTTGQVNASYKNEYTIQQRNIDLADSLKSERDQFQSTHSDDQIKNKIASLIGFERNEREVTAEPVGKVEQWNKVILRKEGTMPVPVLVYTPSERRRTGKTEIWFPVDGKTSLANNSDFLKRIRQSGNTVILADVRGTGETKDPKEFNASKYYDSQYRNDQISLHIGKPVVGQRVQDIETVIDYVNKNSELADQNIEIHASGFVGSPALHAAFMDGRIKHIYLSNTLHSYMGLLKNPTMKEEYAYVVPNSLKYYDLPDLVSIIGSKNVTYITN